MSGYTVTEIDVEDGSILRLTWQVEVDDIVAVNKGMFSKHEDEDAEPDPDAYNCWVTWSVTRRDGRIDPVPERYAAQVMARDRNRLQTLDRGVDMRHD